MGGLPRLALGTQGWSYPDWVGPFYDSGTKPAGYLRQYAREFDSVEIDSTFYGTPTPERLARWAQTVPPGFTFALKLPREITHERRLAGCERPLAEFFAAAQVLGAQLEAVLVQMPPDFSPNEWAALRAFVTRLPAGPRIALELRDPGWFAEPRRTEVLALLRERAVALAVSDGIFIELNVMLAALAHPTASFAYVRWLGRRDSVARFDRATLDRAGPIARWAVALRSVAPRLQRVCGYANNQYMGHSPATIRAIRRELGIEQVSPSPVVQTELFAPRFS